MHRRVVTASTAARTVITAVVATATLASTLLVEPVTNMAMLKNKPDYDIQPDDGLINYNRYQA